MTKHETMEKNIYMEYIYVHTRACAFVFRLRQDVTMNIEKSTGEHALWSKALDGMENLKAGIAYHACSRNIL